MRPPVDRTRLVRFFEQIEKRLTRHVRLYLVGGSVWIHLGIRTSTLDIDYAVSAEDERAYDEIERIIRDLKQELDINIERASPDHFIPVPPNALARSPFVGQFGKLGVYYYHLPSLVLAKVARGYEHDLTDVVSLIQAGHVTLAEVQENFEDVRDSPRGWHKYEPEDTAAKLAMVRKMLREVVS